MTDRMTPDTDQSALEVDESASRNQTTSDSDEPDYLSETEPTRTWPRALDLGRSSE